MTARDEVARAKRFAAPFGLGDLGWHPVWADVDPIPGQVCVVVGEWIHASPEIVVAAYDGLHFYGGAPYDSRSAWAWIDASIAASFVKSLPRRPHYILSALETWEDFKRA